MPYLIRFMVAPSPHDTRPKGVTVSATPNDLLASEVRAELARQRVSVRQYSHNLSAVEKTVQRKVAGESQFNVDELFEYASALGTTASDLLARAEQRMEEAA